MSPSLEESRAGLLVGEWLFLLRLEVLVGSVVWSCHQDLQYHPDFAPAVSVVGLRAPGLW